MIEHKTARRALIALLAALALAACAVNSLGIRGQLNSGAWQQAIADIESTYGDEPALLSLQAGTAWYRAGDYRASNQALNKLAGAMEALRGISISESTTSVLVNDNTRSYVASDFELVAAKSLQIINYLALNQLDAARVEVLQANVLLDQLEGEEKFAFVHALSGVVFEMTGEYDQALVSYRKAVKAYQSQGREGRDVVAPQVVKQAYADLLLRLGLNDELRQSGLQARELPEDAVQVFAVFSGSMVSARVETNIQHYSAQARYNFALSVPHYPPERSLRYRPNTNLANGLLTSMERQQRAALQDERPAIIARTVARLILKRQTQLTAENEGGVLAGLAVGVINNVSEQADTRSADLLPAQLYLAREILSADDLRQRVLVNAAAFQALDGAPTRTYFAAIDEISDVYSSSPQTHQVLIF